MTETDSIGQRLGRLTLAAPDQEGASAFASEAAVASAGGTHDGDGLSPPRHAESGFEAFTSERTAVESIERADAESTAVCDSERDVCAHSGPLAVSAIDRTARVAITAALLVAACFGTLHVLGLRSTSGSGTTSARAPQSTEAIDTLPQSGLLDNRSTLDAVAGSLAVASTTGSSGRVAYDSLPARGHKGDEGGQTTVSPARPRSAAGAQRPAPSPSVVTRPRDVADSGLVPSVPAATPPVLQSVIGSAPLTTASATSGAPAERVDASPTSPPDRAAVEPPISAAVFPTPTAPVSIVSASTTVQRVVSQYARAFGTLDASQVKAMWPTVNEPALRRAFDGLESQNVDIESCTITVTAPSAVALCEGTASYVPKVGSKKLRRERREWTFYLLEKGAQWSILEVTSR